MKLIKKLTSNKLQDSYLGIGLVRAKDYEKEKYGHLLLMSWKNKLIKLFLPF